MTEQLTNVNAVKLGYNVTRETEYLSLQTSAVITVEYNIYG